jgi:hypothetical protein
MADADPDEATAVLRSMLGEAFHAAMRKAIPDSRYGAVIETAIDHMPDEEWDRVLRFVADDLTTSDVWKSLVDLEAGRVVSAEVVEEDLRLRRASSDNEERFMRARWYAVVDDLIGGWAVATADKPVSMFDNRREVVLYETVSERIALHVVRLHNELLTRTQEIREH